MAANFPSTPTTGDIFEAGEYRYEWNGETWSSSPLRINENVTQLQPVTSSTVIDLSLGSYHKVAPAYQGSNTAITFTNIPTGASNWTVEVLHDNNGYNIRDNFISYLDFRYTHFAPVASCEFQPDGSSFIFCTITGTSSYFSFIPTPWTLSQVGGVFSFTLDANLNPVKCLRYNNDGTKLYATGSTDRLMEYSLDIPYYPLTGRTQLVTRFISEISNGISGFTFKPDGTRLYIVTQSNDRIHSYTLSTPWDTSTLTYDSKFLAVGSQDSFPHGVQFNDTGTELYMSGTTNDTIFVYTLSTPWEINTATYSRTQAFSLPGLSDFYISPKGTKVFTTNDNTVTLTMISTFDTTITWPVNVEWNAAPVSQPMQNLIVDFYTNDGGTTIYGVERYNRDSTIYGE